MMLKILTTIKLLLRYRGYYLTNSDIRIWWYNITDVNVLCTWSNTDVAQSNPY